MLYKKTGSLKVIFLFVLIALSCSIKTKEDFGEGALKNNVFNLKSEKILLDGLVSVPLQTLVFKDTLLVINEFRDDYLLSIYNINTGKFIKRLAKVGRGPNEFQPPLQINISFDTLKILERSNFKYYTYLLTDQLDMVRLKFWGQFSSQIQNAYELKEDLFLCPGYYNNDYMFNIYDSSLQEIKNVIKFPDLEINSIGSQLNIMHKPMIYQASILYLGNVDLLVLAYTGIDLIQFYKLEDLMATKINEYKDVAQQFQVYNYSTENMINVEIKDYEINGYSSIGFDENFIYVLAKSVEHNRIGVFDKRGNLKSILKLDRKIDNILQCKNIIYSVINQEGGSYLLKYYLNKNINYLF
jgi:hypothetical protein